MKPAMPSTPHFQAFFSYAHHDDKTDGQLTNAYASKLEGLVNAKLVNATFSIWRDVDRIRIGEKWSDILEIAIRSSSMMIVILSPKWIESDFCRREYKTFCEVESALQIGSYVAPILTRAIESRAHHLTPDQKAVYSDIKGRQYAEVLASDFLKLPESDQRALIEKVADDIEAMIERLRIKATQHPTSICTNRQRSSQLEFTGSAHNYAEVDFISGAEIVLKKEQGYSDDSIFAQVDFVGRLFVQSETARVEFAVRRAYLTIDASPLKLERTDELQPAPDRPVSYVARHDAPGAVCISIEPERGRRSLAELSLPVAPGQNRLARVATMPVGTAAAAITANLTVSLCTSGLQIAGEKNGSLSRNAKQKIAAILGVAASKERRSLRAAHFVRDVEVKDER